MSHHDSHDTHHSHGNGHHHHDHTEHSHPHTHTHTHGHSHDHDHHTHSHAHVHSHSHDHTGDHAHDAAHHDHGGHTHSSVETRSSSTLTFPEKLEKLLSHWIGHNDQHVADYQKWANEAVQNGQPEVAESLAEAAKLTSDVTEKFRQALGRIKA